jgi:tetratricopeptide (TPR) repeat protein
MDRMNTDFQTTKHTKDTKVRDLPFVQKPACFGQMTRKARVLLPESGQTAVWPNMTTTSHFIGTLLALLITVAAVSADTSSADPDKDPQIANLLQDARHQIDGKKPAPAVEMCDKVIAAFKARYGSSKQKIYCARTSAESLSYLLRASHDKTNAIVLSSTWANAYFMKAYALQDLRRIAEGKSNVEFALELSPCNSQYLSELGEVYQLEKNWPKAKQQFESAEDNAKLSPEEAQASELGRARRGLAYVFVELGKLDEAEKKYQQCLAADPNDTRAKRELEYVRELRAKSKLQ